MINVQMPRNPKDDLHAYRRIEAEFVYGGSIWAVLGNLMDDATYRVDLCWSGVSGVDGLEIETAQGWNEWEPFHNYIAPDNEDDVIALMEELVNDPHTLVHLIDSKGQKFIERAAEWTAAYHAAA